MKKHKINWKTVKFIANKWRPSIFSKQNQQLVEIDIQKLTVENALSSHLFMLCMRELFDFEWDDTRRKQTC